MAPVLHPLSGIQRRAIVAHYPERSMATMATVEKTITINAPIERLYAIWTNPQMFPRFMENIEEVSAIGPSKTHWKMQARPQ